MSDRLTELQRQRALMQEQMAKLEQEIATTAKSPSAESAPITAAPTVTPVPASTADQEANDIIAKFGTESNNPVQSARRGCLIVFGLVLTLLALGVYGLYLFSRSRH